MGEYWKDDSDLYLAADVMAERLAGLANKEGTFSGPEGTEMLKHSLREDARQFLTLEPQKIIDEWNRMQGQVANQVWVDLSEPVTNYIDDIEHYLSGWSGDAADAFRDQLSSIKAFGGRMHFSTLHTVRVLGALLGLAVAARDDFYELAWATSDTIKKAFEEAETKESQFAIKVIGELAKTILGGPLDWAKQGAEAAIGIAVEATTLAMDGGSVGEIAENYMRQRDRLLQGCETQLNMIVDELKRAEKEFTEADFKIYHPLPSYANVNSPDFSYERFSSDAYSPAEFGPKVVGERGKQPAGVANPDSPISRRLEGQGR